MYTKVIIFSQVRNESFLILTWNVEAWKPQHMSHNTGPWNQHVMWHVLQNLGWLTVVSVTLISHPFVHAGAQQASHRCTKMMWGLVLAHCATTVGAGSLCKWLCSGRSPARCGHWWAAFPLSCSQDTVSCSLSSAIRELPVASEFLGVGLWWKTCDYSISQVHDWMRNKSWVGKELKW